MRAFCCVGLPTTALHGQQSSVKAEWTAWLSRHAQRLNVEETTSGSGQFSGFDRIVGGARVIAIAEPSHGDHEPLAARNRVIRHLVETKGLSAVVLETGLAQSQELYDYVLGRTTPSDSTLKAAFTYGFGDLDENRELLVWLRAWNSAHRDRPVHLYGLDVPGQLIGGNNSAVRRVLAYLDRVDPASAVTARERWQPLLPMLEARQYLALPDSTRDRVAAALIDLGSVLRYGRRRYAARSSTDSADWALQQVTNAEQDLRFLREAPANVFAWMEGATPKPNTQVREDALRRMMAMRESAMADNVSWIVAREDVRGRVLLFAAAAHVMEAVDHAGKEDPYAPMFEGREPAGLLLRAAFGSDLVTIGSFFGVRRRADGSVGRAPPEDGLERLMSGSQHGPWVVDLRRRPKTGPLSTWMAESHPARGLNTTPRPVVLAGLYDAILFFDTVTVARPWR